jgi:4-amino-4-deoxy-L-arabinose transferase-like glycosyltransferase
VIRFLSESLNPAAFHAGENPRAWTHAKRVIGVALLLRLVYGALLPLFPDETYYWDWSRRLAFGYFDHPPMLAWLIRAGTTLFGDTAFGVRCFTILAGGGCAMGIAQSARSLGGDAAARLAAIVFAVMPLSAAGGVLATPDMPMLCAVSWCIYAVLRAVGLPANADHDDPPADPAVSLRWWVVAGVCIGLAMQSKYTSVLVPAGVAIAFLVHGKLQNRLGQPGPYAAVAIASLIVLPMLAWNFVNDWISFRFQLGHGLGTPKGGALGAVNRELEMIGGQLGLVSPILFFFVLRAIRNGLRYSEEGFRVVLAVASLVPLAFFAYSATRSRVEANWPALAWIPATALLASDLPHSPRMRAWLGRGVALAAVLAAVIYVQVLVPILPLPAARDPVAAAFGWDLVANTVARKRLAVQQADPAAPGAAVYVAAERYQDASEIAFHLDDHPHVYALNLIGRANQYDLWSQFKDDAPLGATLILVLDQEEGEPRAIRKLSCCFNRIDESEGVALMRGNDVVQRKRVWILRGKHDGWPTRDQPFPPN